MTNEWDISCVNYTIMNWGTIWVRSWRCSCLVTWFCYQLIAKPGNKTAAPLWPDPYWFFFFKRDVCTVDITWTCLLKQSLDQPAENKHGSWQGYSLTKCTTGPSILATYILMGKCKKDVTPLLMHWSFVFLALTHQYVDSRSCTIQSSSGYNLNDWSNQLRLCKLDQYTCVE